VIPIRYAVGTPSLPQAALPVGRNLPGAVRALTPSAEGKRFPNYDKKRNISANPSNDLGRVVKAPMLPSSVNLTHDLHLLKLIEVGLPIGADL
jgi:hypothetical protein